MMVVLARIDERVLNMATDISEIKTNVNKLQDVKVNSELCSNNIKIINTRFKQLGDEVDKKASKVQVNALLGGIGTLIIGGVLAFGKLIINKVLGNK